MINNLSLTGLDADYLHQETQTAPTEKVTKEAGKVARETANEPTLEVKVERFTADGRIGFVNQAAKPPYNVFLDGTRDRKSTRPELQSHSDLVCRLLLEKKKKT